MVSYRVADPRRFNADPDPAFSKILDPDPDCATSNEAYLLKLLYYLYILKLPSVV
jgi:hypothetical protein